MGTRSTEDILMRVTEAQFRIKYDGPVADYHDLDAALLAQALMGFSDMGRIAYRKLKPEDTHTLDIKVKALEAGSFEVVLDAVVPALEHAKNVMVGLFTSPDAEAVERAAGLLVPLGGALGIRKWIRGRKYVKEDGDREGSTIIRTEGGDVIQVENLTINLAEDPKFIKAADQTLKPLDDPNYTAMSVQDSKGTEIQRIEESDRQYFHDGPETREVDETLRLEVEVETPQLIQNNRMWTFRVQGQSFNAKMLDKDFAERVEKGEIVISGQTRLFVERREVMNLDKNGVATGVKYEIVKVIGVVGEDQSINFVDGK